MSTSILGAGFRYDIEIIAPDGEVITFSDHNLIPQAGIDFIANLLRAQTSPIAPFYVGIFEGNYVPTSATVAADLPAIECTAYSEAVRPTWASAYDGVSLISNEASKATFTMSAAKRLYGAFLVSSSVKAGNSGTLLSIARFSSPKDVDVGTSFGVTAGLTLIPTT